MLLRHACFQTLSYCEVENKEQSLILICAAIIKGTVVRDYWSDFFHDSTPPTHKIQVFKRVFISERTPHCLRSETGRSVLHCAKNSKTIFPEIKLRSLVPNFYIHVSVIYLYFLTIRTPILLYCGADRSWEYINRSQIHECRTWEQGRAVSFLGIFGFEFAGQCIYSVKGLKGNKQPTALYTLWADDCNTNTFVTRYST
jgi:hypothetical protein